MCRLINVLIVCVSAFVPIDFTHASDNTGQELYSNRYDNLDVDTILSSDRLVNNYVECLINKKPCPPEGKALKRILPEALRTKCGRCSERQKEGAIRVITRLYYYFPDQYNELRYKWDPTGEYHRRFTEYLREEQFNVIRNEAAVPQTNIQRIPPPNALPTTESKPFPTQPQPPPIAPTQLPRTTQRVIVTRPPPPPPQPLPTNPPLPPPQPQQSQTQPTFQIQTQRPTRSPVIDPPQQPIQPLNTFAQNTQTLSQSSSHESPTFAAPAAPQPVVYQQDNEPLQFESSAQEQQQQQQQQQPYPQSPPQPTQSAPIPIVVNDEPYSVAPTNWAPFVPAAVQQTNRPGSPNLLDHFFVAPERPYQPNTNRPIVGFFNHIGTKLSDTVDFVGRMIRNTAQAIVGPKSIGR